MKTQSSMDDVIAVYRRDVDHSLLRENLKLTPAGRLDKFVRQLRFARALRQAGEQQRIRSP